MSKKREIINKLLNKLIKSGVHLGHKIKYWHPSMKKFIVNKYQNIHIINIKKTLYLLHKYSLIIKKYIEKKKKILFICTKPKFRMLISKIAFDLKQNYINYKWIGGMLTNWETIQLSIKKIQELETINIQYYINKITKKEFIINYNKLIKLKAIFNGIKNMNKLPDLLFIIDANNEKIAIKEAKKLNIKICAILDTNNNTRNIDYIIPANDDSIHSINFCLNYIKYIVNK